MKPDACLLLEVAVHLLALAAEALLVDARGLHEERVYVAAQAIEQRLQLRHLPGDQGSTSAVCRTLQAQPKRSHASSRPKCCRKLG